MKPIILFAVSALAIVGLGFANWMMFSATIDISPIAPGAPPSTTVASAESASASILREVKLFQTNVRPLFSPDRRPWTAPPLAEIPEPPALSVPETTIAAAPAPPPDLTLMGIHKTPKGDMVLLAGRTGAAPIWLKTGEKYENWQISKITATSVDLGNGGTQITLELYPPLPPGIAAP